jgi:hypothetical protein
VLLERSRLRSVAVAVGFGALLVPLGLESQQAPQGLEGAWRITEVVRAGARTIDAPQPGILLFTGNYYSHTLITGAEARPDLPTGVVTAENIVTVWNPFTANAGTFEISGSTMKRRPLVAKSPDTMAPGAFNEYTFRLSADTLWVTTVGTEGGAARNPATTRYIRVR